MKKSKRAAALLMAFLAAATVGGCTANAPDGNEPDTEIEDSKPVVPPEDDFPEIVLPPSNGNPEEQPPDEQPPIEQPPEEQPPIEQPPEEQPPEEVPVKNVATYIYVTGDSVNVRSGAGTGYSSYGTVEKSTMYAYEGQTNGWYKTTFKNKTAYISSTYSKLVEMEKSDDERVEAIIAEGTKYLGTKYVYGAVRYHSGNGTLLSGFTTDAFDCSSLMQYIFYKGAGVKLQVTTRTQIVQGTTISKSNLKRGDLMFFTNATRKDYTGIERVGHVALYLGDNLILHTASDYAKIEQISSTRWGYYIQSQRML